jgi:CRISPR-associated protein Cas2
MRHLISYDIPSTPGGDRRRARIARYLEGLGLRVQFSLFELELPPERLPAVVAHLESLHDPSEDSIRVYPICSACSDRSHRLGMEAPCEHGPLLIW